MKKHYALLLFISFVFAINCSSDPFMEEETMVGTKGVSGDVGPSGSSGLTDYVDGQVILGADVPEIYSVRAMRSAYQARYPNGGQYGPNAIRTTHYYVRFLPKTEEEYYSIDHLDLSPLPYHKEITQGGSVYHDPNIPEEQYSWQYAIIPINELNTTVEYEILEELFLIDENPDGPPGIPGAPGAGGSSMSYDFWKTLTESSENIAIGGNGQAGPPGSAWWYPSGQIRTYDDKLGMYIPIVNAEISIWHGLRKSRVRTDANGYFRSGKSFKASELYYRLNWEGDKFTIYEGPFCDQAFMCNGKKISGPWYVDIRPADYNRKQLASIYRACDRTYRKDYLSMMRPEFSGRICIRYVDGEGPSLGRFRGCFVTSRVFPSIKIWGKYNGRYRLSDQIFGTTIHELAHAAHYKKAGFLDFTRTNDNILESWARAVQYYVSKKEYEEYGKNIDEYDRNVSNIGIVTYGSDGGNVGAYIKPTELNVQDWPVGHTSLEYSSLIIDLVDSNNQMGYYQGLYPNDKRYRNYPNDKVIGFELHRIQGVLNDFVNVGTFKTKIKNLNTQYYSAKNTNAEIDSLFKRYEQRW